MKIFIERKNTVRGRLSESRLCLGEVMSRVLDAEDRGEVVVMTVRGAR